MLGVSRKPVDPQDAPNRGGRGQLAAAPAGALATARAIDYDALGHYLLLHGIIMRKMSLPKDALASLQVACSLDKVLVESRFILPHSLLWSAVLQFDASPSMESKTSAMVLLERALSILRVPKFDYCCEQKLRVVLRSYTRMTSSEICLKQMRARRASTRSSSFESERKSYS